MRPDFQVTFQVIQNTDREIKQKEGWWQVDVTRERCRPPLHWIALESNDKHRMDLTTSNHCNAFNFNALHIIDEEADGKPDF